MQYTNIKQRIVDYNTAVYENIEALYSLPVQVRNREIQRIHPGFRLDEALRQTAIDLNERAIASTQTAMSKVIVFPTEQVEVFAELIANKRVFPLEFQLPFDRVLIQLSNPLTLHFGSESWELSAMLIFQATDDRQSYEMRIKALKAEDARLKIVSPGYLEHDWSISETVVTNVVVAFDRDFDPLRLVWTSKSAVLQSVDPDGTIVAASTLRRSFRALAIACIGYINCENIYLHKEGEVPESVNRKRAKQGKKILEPYYVCRIRGVQYDSDGEPTGEGTHHGFRYDVRGHFRKLATGKTTWVRPHQRGLANELYIPKTYVVENGAKVLA